MAVVDADKTAGEATVKELSSKYPWKVVFLLCDITNHDKFEECIKRTIEKFSQLDIVINNAGIGVEKGDVWEKLIDVNFKAVVKGSKLGMKYMGKDNGGKGGTIVNVSSLVSLFPFPPLPVYAACKAAVNHFTRSFGHETYFDKSGVRVICICPGLTETQMSQELIPEALMADAFLIDSWKHLTEITYLQKAESVAHGLLWVLENGKSGSVWAVDKDELPKPAVV